MGLKDFVLPTLEVNLGTPDGASFSVRGVSLNDITELLSKHGPVMEQFYKKYSKGANQMDTGTALLKQAPDLVAQIIALAADEPDMAPSVKKMSVGIQQDALEKIAKLTFDASGGPKKFVETVMSLIQSTTSTMESLTPSKSG